MPISIHALLAESDAQKNLRCQYLPISIHALLAESDLLSCFGRITNVLFLSTLSLRRATQAQGLEIAAHSISIHALLAESDNMKVRMICSGINFYPRSPCGERPGA